MVACGMEAQHTLVACYVVAKAVKTASEMISPGGRLSHKEFEASTVGQNQPINRHLG
jgi:hypothetical protein